MRIVGLTISALLTYFIVVPVLIVLGLTMIALGVMTIAGGAVGMFSLIGWFVTDNPETGRAAAMALGAGAVSFIAIVILWDWIFSGVAWLVRSKDARFNG